MRMFLSISVWCIIFLLALDVGAIEFDQRAAKMGLKGLAWDTTFTVYGSDDELAKETFDHIKNAYAKILRQLDQKILRKKCLVFIWRDRTQYILQAGMFLPRGDIVNQGAFVTREFWGDYHALFTSMREDLYNRILPHELAHLVLPLYLGGDSIPLWLNEGFAQCQEDDSFEEAVGTVAAAVERGEIIPLKTFTVIARYPSSRERNTLFYDQSELLVHLLLARQKRNGVFFDFAHSLTVDRKNFSDALATCYPQWVGVEDLQKEYIAEVKRFASAIAGRYYRKGYLSIQAAKECESRSEREKAVQKYARALDEFTFITDRFASFKQDGVRSRITECRQGMARLSGMAGGIAVGDSCERVIAFFGKPESISVEKMRYPGVEIELDKNRRVASIVIAPPCNKVIYGVKIGDPLQRAEMLHGVRGDKEKSEIAQALCNQEKILSTGRLGSGTYPVISKGKFLGQVIRLKNDNELHFIAPMSAGGAIEEIECNNGRIAGIEIYSPECDQESAEVHEVTPCFEIGDDESKFASFLGEPMGREPKLFFHEERYSYRRRQSESTISDRLQAFQLLYDGLYVITSRRKAIYMVATPSCKARVCGIAVGDSREQVVKRLGKPDRTIGKDNSMYMYTPCAGRVRIYVLLHDNKVTKVKAYRTEYLGMKLRFGGWMGR